MSSQRGGQWLRRIGLGRLFNDLGEADKLGLAASADIGPCASRPQSLRYYDAMYSRDKSIHQFISYTTEPQRVRLIIPATSSHPRPTVG